MDLHKIDLMSAIADRGLKMLPTNLGIRKIDVMMDLEYTNEETPLDLEKFLNFDGGDFAHDICGIFHNFNRATKSMDNFFVPRCAVNS